MRTLPVRTVMRNMFAIRDSVPVVTVFTFIHLVPSHRAERQQSCKTNIFSATVRRLGELPFTMHLVAHVEVTVTAEPKTVNRDR